MKTAILYNYKEEPPYNLKIEDVKIDKPMIFELIKRGLVNIDKLVTGKYGLEQINEAFEDLEIR